jgi:signal transduction histidine kinase
VLLFLLLSPPVVAQQNETDSLIAALGGQQGDARVRTLVALCDAARTLDLHQSLDYGQQAVALARTLDSRKSQSAASISMGWTLLHLNEIREAREKLRVGLRETTRSGDPLLHARALRGLGIAEKHDGQLDSALSLARQAKQISDQSDDIPGSAAATREIGAILRSRGSFEEAMACFQDALRKSASVGDTFGIVRALIMRGDIHRRQGAYDAALSDLRRSLEITVPRGDRSAKAMSMYMLGSVKLNHGEYDSANVLFNRSLELYRALGDESGMAIVYTYLGHIHNMQTRFATALQNYERGLTLNERLGNKSGMIGSLISIGNVQFKQSRSTQALDAFQRSLRLCEEIGQHVLKASALIHIGRVHNSQSRHDQALESFRQAMEVFEGLGDQAAVSVARNFIADVLAEQGAEDEALNYYRQSVTQFQRDGDRLRHAQTLNSIGAIQAKQSRYSDALSSHHRSLLLLRELGDRAGVAEALSSIGYCLMQQGAIDSAITCGREALSIATEIGSITQAKDAAKTLSDAFSRKNDFARAYEYHREFTIYKDSLLNEKNVRTINEMAAKFDADSQERKIALLERDQALQRLALQRQQEALLREQLASGKKQQQLDLLGKEKEIQDLTLAKANVDLEKQRLENARKRNEVELLTKDKQLQSSLLERETFTRNVSILGILIMFVITGLLLHRYRYRKKTTEQLTNTLTQLRVTQSQLIHAEKMVTLGEMTAGLAHEIKNPLNFVTNFSTVAKDMLTDFEQAEDEEERAAVLADLRSNLTRIVEHGRRADSIIEGMMLHARGGVGESVITDINELVDDAVNLAYHGMRATHISFDVTIEKSFYPGRLETNVIPQEISRVLLNLLNNAMYAVSGISSPSQETLPLESATPALVPQENSHPKIWITTALRDHSIEIRVRDNGPGIPEHIHQKIFEPFFTTKPTGEGSGLGLSMSYDIIVNGHGGSLTCSSSDAGAEFVITLPPRNTVS